MEESNVLDAGTVWMVTSAAMVLLMTPGLAIFYGGMTRAKSSLNMIMMSFVSMGLVGVVWVLRAAHGKKGRAQLADFAARLDRQGVFQSFRPR